jgi:glucose-1-phosphate cytidylyltransferase
MKCVILAGGKGTRIAEESNTRPKPMVEIGSKPILWHIMKLYASFGVNEFIVCLGYKGYMVKEYFANYFLHQADVTFDMQENLVQYHDSRSEPWKVTLVDTGEETMTGGRLLQVGRYLNAGEPFCMTYGDGLADIDIRAQLAFHREHGRKATVSCVRPPARFGRVAIQGTQVTSFEEKPQAESGLINGGFFVLHPSVLELIDGFDTVWEKSPMESLAADGQLAAWIHRGFWQPMDTLRDKQHLNSLWDPSKSISSGTATSEVFLHARIAEMSLPSGDWVRSCDNAACRTTHAGEPYGACTIKQPRTKNTS